MGDLVGMCVAASDGEIGRVKDVYIDERDWAARYLVVHTGTWLDGRMVLISPLAVKAIDWGSGSLQVDLSIQRIAASPVIDTDKALSRQDEAELSGYYGYPGDWRQPPLWGGGLCPLMPTGRIAQPRPSVQDQAPPAGDLHPRGLRQETDDDLQATEASIGDLEVYLID
jgi:hypothetical protein